MIACGLQISVTDAGDFLIRYDLTKVARWYGSCERAVPMNPDEQSVISVEQPYETWLCQSDRVSVSYSRLMPACWPDHQHRQAKLFLTFDDASAEITWQGRAGHPKKQVISAHQFCLIPPDCRHTFDWKNEADVVTVLIEDQLLRGQMNGAFHSVVVDDFHALARPDACLWSIGTIFRELCRTSVLQPASFVEGIGTALAVRFLERHFHSDSHGAHPRPKLTGEALHRMEQYIRVHMHEAITVADLARDAGLSVDYFSRLAKNTTGSSPLHFLQKCRVEKALGLLRTGKFRVAEAACEVGFYDQSHLDRHCRKFFGFSPKTAMPAEPSAVLSLKKPEASKIFTIMFG